MKETEEFKFVRPDELFGFPKMDLSNIQEAKDQINCPCCGEETPDDVYYVDGVEYPQCYNEDLFSSDTGTRHNWDEVHVCQKCGTVYLVYNGCY